MPAAQLLHRRFRRLAAHLHQIGLLHPRRCAGQRIGQRAVVGHQQQAFALVVQPAHRKDPRARALKKLHHRRPALRIGNRRHVPLWLVQHVVARLLRLLQQLAVHADVVPRRVRLRAQLRHHLAVHPHAPFGDQRLRLASRGHSGGGNDLLQPLRRALRPVRLR